MRVAVLCFTTNSAAVRAAAREIFDVLGVVMKVEDVNGSSSLLIALERTASEALADDDQPRRDEMGGDHGRPEREP